MAKFGHKSTDQLPPEAQRIMAAGFAQKLTVKAIAARLAEIGVEVPERTIARRAAEWRFEQNRRQAARENVQHLVDALKDGPNPALMLQALAVDGLLANPEAWAGQDPMKVQQQNLIAEDLRIKREQLELRKSQHELNRRKFEAMERRERQARELAEESEKREMTPEEMRAKIREIYGLSA